MAEQIKQELIRKRAAIKGALTSHDRAIANFVVDTPEAYQTLLFKQSRLLTILEKYDEVQGQIESLEDAQEEDYFDREEFETKFGKSLGIINVLVEANTPQDKIVTVSGSVNDQNQTFMPIKLPEIHIPEFDGDFTKWLEFRDTFQAIVINRNDLPQISKFHYLQSSLKGEARKLIQNITASEANFSVAWELLSTRYNDIRLIANTHIRDLFDPPSLLRNNASSLRHLIDHFNSHVNALRTLDLNDVSLQDLLLSHMLIKTLDSVSLREWQNSIQPNQIPTFKDLLQFLENRCKVLESLNVNTNDSQKTSSTKPQTQVSINTNKCSLCNGQHNLFLCESFRKLSPQEKLKHVKTYKLCMACLHFKNANHQCTYLCRLCNSNHHILLHQALSNPKSAQASTFSPRSSNEQVSVACSSQHSQTQTRHSDLSISSQSCHMLPTARVKCHTRAGKVVSCVALLDSGSTVNLITVRLADKLKLPTSCVNTVLETISNQALVSSEITQLEIESCNQPWRASITCNVVQSISQALPTSPLDTSNWQLPPGLVYANNDFATPQPIDLLLGADVFFHLLADGKFTPKHECPVIQNTKLGWILAGKVPRAGPEQLQSAMIATVISRQQVQAQLERFWHIEEINDRLMTTEESMCEEHFKKTVSRDSQGRYVVRLPRKADVKTLGASRSMALKRFQSLEKRLDRDPILKQDYHEFMNEYEELGHMALVPDVDVDPNNPIQCYHIPHHPVIKLSSTTTKLRVVFDASAVSTTGVSLNDTLMKGPVIQPDLFNIILNFRTHKIAFAADITKMYRQVLVHPEDYNLQRILWRKSSFEPIQEYHLKTVTYGTTSASYLATRALKQLTIDEGKSFPRAAAIINSDFYVDDCISGCETEEQAKEIYHELNGLLSLGGLQLRKWTTNSIQLLNIIPEADRETQSIRGFGDSDESVVKTLGLFWQPENDQFRIQSPTLLDVTQIKFTKRILLSTIASIFDPLGLIAPVVVKCKILFQSLWAANIGWDDELPSHIYSMWLDIYCNLPQISELSIPRLVKSTVQSATFQLHGFCDSSEQAYGACLYLLSRDPTGQVTCHLLCAKSRVAPVKKLTIPKLELCAALLLSKLLVKVRTTFHVSFKSVTLWTDSTIVLAWIGASPHKWKTFVANRVAEIQANTPRCSWRHVVSGDNPADMISRGVTAPQLKNSCLWWHGPAWLNDHAYLDCSEPSHIVLDQIPEQRICNVIMPVVNFDEQILQRFSRYPTTVRVIAYCKRFIHNCRSKASSATMLTGPLTAIEIDHALISCIKIIQKQYFHAELTALKNKLPLSKQSSLLDLHPFLDSDDTLRVGGRLQNSELPFDAKHQIILPANHFSRKLVRSTHLRLLHGGINLIIADIRQRFWILGIRRLVRSVVRHCLTCFRFNAKPMKQIMGQLPSARVQPSHPFLNVGIDYAGPFTIHYGGPRSKATTKAYLAVFVCLATKAVHVEVVTSLTTAAFIAAFSRFYCRRGIPSQIFSDNGSNFVGAQRELNELSKMFSSTTFYQYLEEVGTKLLIQWHFIPPRAPHFGGLWEAAIKSLKFHLRRIISPQMLTYEELATVVIQIEAVLNSRPISTMSEDPSDLTYLSPGHFLIGRALTTLPSPGFTDVSLNRLSRWQQLQRLLTIFWRKWSADYLQTLQRRAKWKTESANIKVNSVVLIKEDDVMPLQWKLGIVHETHSGPDGKVRVCTLRTMRGLLKRSINRICPLPIDSDDEHTIFACGETPTV